ncbi:hypothetical protein OSCT_2255 [Oscillochloris trichoides DG-6]|uniref:Uncharacterized protein n=1 Tax=Oscillochloris trichoides DG-6 TaxID=765420 RepID=E1IFZ1_9CHLR|nr:hypothetical protein [Oscillochloris trichoides]EFO79880.1 hypothetical protein OSCT_2255 [Oscillochloris trichoides DG-6]
MNIPTPARRSIHVPGLVYAALVLGLFFGSILIAQASGLWSVSGKFTPNGVPVQLSGTDPATIKGWMTIQAVLDAYPVDQASLYRQFGIPEETPSSTPLKDLEAVVPGFSVTALHDWLSTQVVP